MNFFRITDSGYKFDKRLFRATEVIMIVFLFLLFQHYNFDFSYHPYFECKDSHCLNPFSDVKYSPPVINRLIPSVGNINCDWCSIPVLNRGVYGKPNINIPKIIFLTVIFYLSVVLLMLYLNHAKHNVGKKFNIGLKEQHKWLDKFKDVKGGDEKE